MIYIEVEGPAACMVRLIVLCLLYWIAKLQPIHISPHKRVHAGLQTSVYVVTVHLPPPEVCTYCVACAGVVVL